MPFEHSIMLVIALACLAAARRDGLAAVSVLLSQVPFWMAYGWYLSTDGGPVFYVNLATDLSIATLFLISAHIFDRWYLGVLSSIFWVASVIDIISLTIGFDNYFIAHEVLHYLALLAIVGRKGVDRVIATRVRRSGPNLGLSRDR